jgi:hypothetical protein
VPLARELLLLLHALPLQLLLPVLVLLLLQLLNLYYCAGAHTSAHCRVCVHIRFLNAQDVFLRLMRAAADSHRNDVLDTLPQVRTHSNSFTYVLGYRHIIFACRSSSSNSNSSS